MSTYCPVLTNAGLTATQPTTVVDEYQNTREINIAHERSLTIYIDRLEIITLMTIGAHPELLTLGYIKNQGLISDLTKIKSVQVDWDVSAVAVATVLDQHDWKEKLGRRIVTTGCGQGTVLGSIMEQLNKTTIMPHKIKQSQIYALLKNLNAYSSVYKKSGAVHGCALCSGVDALVFMEDIGRHNAVDAIAGNMWLNDITGANKLFYTTGRLTSEMVLKTAQMGIPAALSRSGVTRMGLQLAQDKGITLIARAQSKHFLVYNGAEHIEFDVKLPDKFQVANLK